MPQLANSSGVPLRRSDPRRVFLVSCPSWLKLPALGPRKREYLVYFSGFLVRPFQLLSPTRES